MSKKCRSSIVTVSKPYIVVLALLSVLTMQGCASVSSGTKLPDMPSSLMQQCPPPQSELKQTDDLRDVLMAHANEMQALDICSGRLDSLSQWVRNLYKKQK